MASAFIISPSGKHIPRRARDSGPHGFNPLVYLASPGFTDAQKELLTDLESWLWDNDLDVYSPFRDGIRLTPDATRKDRRDVWKENVWAIGESDLIVALLDDKDTGTLVEFGMAVAMKKPIVAYAPRTAMMNVMLAEAIAAYACNGSEFSEVMIKLRNLYANPPGRNLYAEMEQLREDHRYRGQVQ